MDRRVHCYPLLSMPMVADSPSESNDTQRTVTSSLIGRDITDAAAADLLRSSRRHLEKIWLRTRSSQDLKLFRTAYHSAIIQAKKVFNSSLISFSSKNPRKLWNSINKLLHRKPMSQLPFNIDSKSLPSMFASFFSD